MAESDDSARGRPRPADSMFAMFPVFGPTRALQQFKVSLDCTASCLNKKVLTYKVPVVICE